MDADWPTRSVRKVRKRGTATAVIRGEPSQMYENAPWSLVTPRNLSRTPDFRGPDSLTVIPPAENYPDTVSLFSKNILTAARTASAILSLRSRGKG